MQYTLYILSKIITLELCRCSDKTLLLLQRKKFELRPFNEDRLVYYTNSDDKSKRLLLLCRETHKFRGTVYPLLFDASLNNNTSGKFAVPFPPVVRRIRYIPSIKIIVNILIVDYARRQERVRRAEMD